MSEIAADGGSFICKVPAGSGEVKVGIKLAVARREESSGAVDGRLQLIKVVDARPKYTYSQRNENVNLK